MSDVLTAQIGMLIESNNEIKEVQIETNRTLNRFIEVSVRNEERQGHSAEALKRLGKRVDILWDMVHKNSIIVNGALILISGSVGSYVTYLIAS